MSVLSAPHFHDEAKAFEYLERSYQRRDWGMALLKIDPRLDPLRDDPRYKNLLMRVEGR